MINSHMCLHNCLASWTSGHTCWLLRSFASLLTHWLRHTHTHTRRLWKKCMKLVCFSPPTVWQVKSGYWVQAGDCTVPHHRGVGLWADQSQRTDTVGIKHTDYIYFFLFKVTICVDSGTLDMYNWYHESLRCCRAKHIILLRQICARAAFSLMLGSACRSHRRD